MKGGRTKCLRLGDLIEETGFFVMTLEEEGFSLENFSCLNSLNSKEEEEEDADSIKTMI
jgi:hypothetical protein